MMAKPRLEIAHRVTRRHGVSFAMALAESATVNDVALDAFDAAKVVEWPESESWEVTPEQARYHELAEEIWLLTFEIARDAIGSAFTTAAGEVLERERHRCKKRKRA